VSRPRRRRGPLATLLLSLLVTGVDASLLALALGGYRAVLSHDRALALLGIWAVCGATLALLRPVGAQDVVEAGRESLPAFLALGLVPIFTPAIAALGERLGIGILPGGAPLRWAGVALAAIGLVLRISAIRQLGSRFSPRLAVQRQHPLETTGLYRRIRHPGYLGSFLAALGAVLAFGSALGFAPLLLFAALIGWRVRGEEKLLAARFGESWNAYRSRSGAFFPRP
jgi:protein-S-isoprenylcysteine O-methyltransferase Ste14